MLELGVRPSGNVTESPVAELRALVAADWPTVADIYWDGMRDGLATFETEVPSWEAWDAAHHADHRLVAIVGGEIAGWATLSPTSHRRCYAGVAEDSVYVARGVRGRGIGRQLLSALVESADRGGIWTIQTSLFPENRASLALHQSCGFRVVGRRERIAKRDGVWRDTVLLERRSDTR